MDPFVQDGGRLFLNPAAFRTPKPGDFGNLERNSIHGPNFSQIDMVVSKKFATGRGSNFEFRLEVFNIFNQTNFANPSGTLPNALPGANESATQANRTQPGQPFTAANVGAFAQVTSPGRDDHRPGNEPASPAGFPSELLARLGSDRRCLTRAAPPR